jgi:hypothetical protein
MGACGGRASGGFFPVFALRMKYLETAVSACGGHASGGLVTALKGFRRANQDGFPPHASRFTLHASRKHPLRLRNSFRLPHIYK